VPRGGARRRKSMEPKALANLNGMLVSSPVKGGARDAQTAPNTPMNRRDSTIWMRTPPEQITYEDEHDTLWAEEPLLTPIPMTPAPEMVARFAAQVSPDTPSDIGGHYEEDDNDGEDRENLMTRTCPPKKSVYTELGDGILGKEKDEGVLIRLMAARRKSLQFAPKVGSPLSKTWN
jgi:hypothetical protein